MGILDLEDRIGYEEGMHRERVEGCFGHDEIEK